MADIIFINPRFEVSYWGLEHALPLIGKKANMPMACLPLLAGLDALRTFGDPARREHGSHRFRSVRPGGHRRPDRDGRPARSDAGDPDRAQAARGVRGRGGAWATVKEDDFDGLADAIFIGEAEQTWPRFLDEWQRGEHQYAVRAGRADRHVDGARRRDSTCSR